ncbi:TRAP transporter small permease [Rhodobium gokarnense]|uniref:TRAP transporter small permease protein n=1 Tax=Rhodobium gokarnense TaxID=364296 RepID=A0ABT3H8V3_9HYPH|nr:TRAP transporter small permease [Rhodobium gokarnense]MCW2306837.1 C4-dicarboxylate transporter DctQ subunit [Rhodobium gokarnense]
MSRIVNEIEETAIAVLLALMTVTTFSNVVARYVFNDNLLWALELTTYFFAWLVIFGASYAVKMTAHLGVDAVALRFPRKTQRILALIAVAACIAYAGMMLYGAWEYWSKFFFKLAFLEVEDVPFPHWIQTLFGLVEDGEVRYERLPRYIPYFILPFGLALILFRFLQIAVSIFKGDTTMIIASHEAEELVDEARAAHDENGTSGEGAGR